MLNMPGNSIGFTPLNHHQTKKSSGYPKEQINSCKSRDKLNFNQNLLFNLVDNKI